MHFTGPGSVRAGPQHLPLIRRCEVPVDSLLRAYQDAAGFADCCVTEVAGTVSQAAFVQAFYCSPLFKVERTLLAWLGGKPANDADARRLAEGSADRFSAWRVERRSASELLLADSSGRTRSWLSALPAHAPGEAPGPAPCTRLYFGSAVVPRQLARAGKPGLGWAFHALLGFHRLYSRLLLRAASRRVHVDTAPHDSGG